MTDPVTSEDDAEDDAEDAAARPIASREDAQRRCDELWTKTVNVVSATGLRFISQSEVTARHVIVDSQKYGVRLTTPTHGGLEAAVWPALGAALMKDVKKRGRPCVILPRRTIQVDRWKPAKLEVSCHMLFFEVEGSPIVIAQPGEVPG